MLKLSQLNMNYVDHHLTGRQFEFYVASLLRMATGDSATVTPESNDHGIDIIAGSIYGVQVKLRHKGCVGYSAVEETVAGMEYYQLNCGLIITNTSFSNEAIESAKKFNIRLFDRHELNVIMNKARNRMLDYTKLNGLCNIQNFSCDTLLNLKIISRIMGFDNYQNLIDQMISEYTKQHFDTHSKMKDFYKIRRLTIEQMKIQKHLINS